MFFQRPSDLAKVIALRVDALTDAKIVGILGDALAIDEQTAIDVDMTYHIRLYVRATDTRMTSVATLNSKADIRHVRDAVHRLYGRALSGAK
jgi:CRISPR/Cas system-associated exonuclease Cas4 (RecB family)